MAMLRTNGEKGEKVRLKANMILDGRMYFMDSVVEKEIIPVRLRKARWCEEYVGEPKVLKKVRKTEEESL